MRNTTANNLSARHKWLKQALSRQITPTRPEIQAISSMRDFCKLEVPNWFKPISLNTLKQAAKASKLGPDNHLWVEIIQMRVRTFELYTPKALVTTAPILPGYQEQARIALLEAHVASMAYFDIYKFLELINTKGSDSAQEILASVALKIKTSKAIYQSFLIGNSMISSENMKVIDGGKKIG